MRVLSRALEISGSAGTDVVDVTPQAREFVAAAGVRDGILVVFTPGSTAAVTTIEFEPGAVEDFKRMLEQVAPRHAEYEHNLRWGDGNGYSHVRAALIGPDAR